MKGKEITAQSSTTGQIIVERFMEDGTRFIKQTPYSPLLFKKLKEQFEKKNVFVQESEKKWVMIKKTGENPDLKHIAEQAYGQKEIGYEDILHAEVDLLKKAGYNVQIKDFEVKEG